MSIQSAKAALDTVIRKSRVHLYKPIQIAEILYYDRTQQDIDLATLESYRTPSRQWRDRICRDLLNRTCSSSSRFQDNLFENNAIPPSVLVELGRENRQKSGIVEAYIYSRFQEKYNQITKALLYCQKATPATFDLSHFLSLFRDTPGLRRSVDKVYEIVVYSLFSVLVDELGVEIEVSYDPDKVDLLREFEDFAKKIICIDTAHTSFTAPARLFRVGVTNAADRGLDMWANFGSAIQIKHLVLDEKRAEDIVESISADRIVIVCKDQEQGLILSLVNQLGWKARVQSVVTETNLIGWYKKALCGSYSALLGTNLLQTMIEELKREFPSSGGILEFFELRGYDRLSDPMWEV